MFDSALNIVVVLAILVWLVVIHELGHFLVARFNNVRVEEFGIGFPPRALVFKRGKETLYTLNWLPIGGFVRLEGEEGTSADPRAFVNQRLRVRLAILFAGVVMNFLLAWLIFTLISGFADPVTEVRIGCVQPNSPAAAIGLIPGKQTGTDPATGNAICDATGDTIVAINGQTFPAFDDLESGDAPVRYLRAHAGQTITLTVRHPDGTVETKTATLREQTATQGALGISPAEYDRTNQVQHDILTAIVSGFQRTVAASTLILRALGDFVTNLANPQVSGPIGIVGAVGAVRTELPPVFLFWLIGMLSANLAVVNILPFPPMDGGRIAVSLVQAASGNRVSPSLERAVYLAGFIVLMTLLVWISLFDTGILTRQAGT